MPVVVIVLNKGLLSWSIVISILVLVTIDIGISIDIGMNCHDYFVVKEGRGQDLSNGILFVFLLLLSLLP